jgi:hypothetical protein
LGKSPVVLPFLLELLAELTALPPDVRDEQSE